LGSAAADPPSAIHLGSSKLVADGDHAWQSYWGLLPQTRLRPSILAAQSSSPTATTHD